MRNKMTELIALILALIMALSAVSSLTSCNSGVGNTSPESGNSTTEEPIVMEKPFGTIRPSTVLWNTPLDTLHSVNVQPGTIDLITDGKTEYRIVIPASASDRETLKAAKELQYFFGEATGAQMEIVTDADLIYDASAKFISIGDTSLADAAGIKPDKNILTVSGYRIESKDQSVFLIGGGSFGNLYAAYEFLFHEIGFEAYSYHAIDYKTETTVKLHRYDVTDVPDIQYSIAQLGWQFFNEDNRDRMRYNDENDIWMGPRNVLWHNSLNYLPKAQYQGLHPDWYATDGLDLCFHARGNEEEYKLFFAEFMKNFISVLNDHPRVENITITQQDYNSWCKCAACTADKEKYGSNSATIIKFCNEVSDALEAYFKENGIDRNVNICFFAYQQTTEAPVRKDDDGKYVPIDDEIICRDNVGCFYAPIRAEFIYDFSDPANAFFLDTMDKYCAITSKLYLWLYTINFGNLFTPYDTLHSMQNTYIVAKAHNAVYLFDQVAYSQNSLSDWAMLRTYLSSKLRWNVKADVEQLFNNFMSYYYKDAAPAMKSAFDLYSTWFEYLRSEKNVGGSYLDSTLFTTANFPKGFVDGMLKAFDEAYKAIEPLKDTQPAIYEAVRKRICLETICYQYLNISFYSASYSASELLNLKLQFKQSCTETGVLRYHESKDLEELYSDWGID